MEGFDPPAYLAIAAWLAFASLRDTHYPYDIAARAATAISAAEAQQVRAAAPERRLRDGHTNIRGPRRAQQFVSAVSPDQQYEAFYRDRNVWLKKGDAALAITINGSEQTRVKNGSVPMGVRRRADQGTAIW